MKDKRKILLKYLTLALSSLAIWVVINLLLIAVKSTSNFPDVLSFVPKLLSTASILMTLISLIMIIVVLPVRFLILLLKKSPN